MRNQKLDKLDTATPRIQALIDPARPLKEWPTEIITIMPAEMSPTWKTDTVLKAHNLILVDKAMYAGIPRHPSPVDLLALYYTFGLDCFASPPFWSASSFWK